MLMKNMKVLKWWFIIALLCLIPQLTFAQNIQVQGSITDEMGETMIGVSVLIKGTASGTITDSDGNFTLSVPAESTLVVSYVGYKTQEVKVGNRKILKISMDPDAQALDEVVVIAYGQQKKVTVTGSVSNVNSKELLKSPSASLGNAISGKLPGLSTVQYSGLPGADDPTIFIRRSHPHTYGRLFVGR